MKGNISLMDKRKRRNKEWIYERKWKNKLMTWKEKCKNEIKWKGKWIAGKQGCRRIDLWKEMINGWHERKNVIMDLWNKMKG